MDLHDVTFPVLGLTWLLAVGEQLSAARFEPWAYRLGPVVLRWSQMLPPSIDGQSTVAPLDEDYRRLVVKQVGPGRWLFRAPYWRDFTRPHLLGVTGAIDWRGPAADVTVRVPLFATLFVAEVLLSQARLVFMFGADVFVAAPIELAFILVVGGVVWVRVSKGREHARQAVLELLATLEQRAGADVPPSR